MRRLFQVVRTDFFSLLLTSASLRKSFSLVVILLLSFTVRAQKEITITGIVKDEKTIVMQGVTVSLKGTTKKVVTNADGKYEIKVPNKQAILVFTFVGYVDQELGVGNKTILDVTMKEEAGTLNEVVVIGYGQVKRKDLTGSVAKANVEDMQKANVSSFVDALGGRIAGVVVTSNDGQPGAAPQITIRGSSVTQDASPLYVIDGFPIENFDINAINPNDIESLEILKDASSIAIYGARGANGVILITTKRGRSGPTRISYNVSLAAQRDLRRMEMLSPYEFVKLQLELDSIRSTPVNRIRLFTDRYIDENKGITLDSYRNVEGYDWQDLVLQTGLMQTHNLSISGGNSDTRYSITGNYLNQKGIILNTGMRRYDGKITLDTRIAKNVRLGVSASFANTETFGTLPTAGNGGGVVANMWGFRPVDVLNGQNLEASTVDSTNLIDNPNTTLVPDNLVNPLQQAQNEYRKNITATAIVNAFVEYTFWKNFKLRISGGFNSTTARSEAFYNSKTSQGTLLRNLQGTPLNNNGINGQINNQINSNYLNENTISYRNKFGTNHVLDAVAGFTYQYARNTGYGFRTINIPEAAEFLGIRSLNSGFASMPVTAATHWQLFSFLSRVNYTYKDRYLFTASMRSDGSSKFAPGRQWGYFPSGAFAWKFTKEKFADNWKDVINDGKLRVSYGTVGNNKVGDFSFLSQFGALQNSAGYPINNNYVAGIVPFFYGNENITWETTSELDFGINLVMLNERLSIDADYYSRTTKDFLIGVPIPFFAGYANGTNTQYQNTGRVRNSGVELTVTGVVAKGKKFNWTSSFNISFNNSKILEFYDGFEVRGTTAQIPGIPTASQPVAWIAAVGAPLAQFYGYVWAGVYQYSDFDRLPNGTFVLKNGVPSYAPANANTPIQPGDPKYADINGDGIVDASDQRVIGRPLPIHTGGFTNNFSYKNWSLNVFMQWSYGNDVLNANRLVFESGSYYINTNQFASFANRWTPTNPTNELPRATFNIRTDVGGLTRVSDRMIEDASFLRLKTVTLGYNLPAKLMKKIRFTNVKVFVSAQNLLTLTNYTGLDPEVSTYRQANPANAPAGSTGQANTGGTGYSFIQPSSSYVALSPGYDYTPYPRAMTLTFGVGVTF
jgi:TonB-linked SusC/RagA family outer membrane protein